MGKMKQVNVRVPKETKERWDEATEEYGSLTRLIQTAVNNQLSGDTSTSSESQSAASSETMEDLAATIDSLENTVRDMDQRLTAMRDTIESEGPDYSFRAAVHETVPEEGGLTTGEIAARLDARESDVAEVLEDLEDQEEVSKTGTSVVGGPVRWQRWD